jgi:hypothetical protein
MAWVVDCRELVRNGYLLPLECAIMLYPGLFKEYLLSVPEFLSAECMFLSISRPV